MKWSFLPPFGFSAPVVIASLTVYWLFPVEIDDPIAAPRSTLPAVGISSPDMPPTTDLAIARSFIEYPLLAENRQMPTIASSEPEPAPIAEPEASQPELSIPITEPPRLLVTGFMSNDGTQYVLLRDQDTEIETWATLGQSFGDWVLVEITQVDAVLEALGTQITIKLFEDRLP